ncbi:hypothetical protein ACLHIL_03075 [Trueperella sp. LYQ143]
MLLLRHTLAALLDYRTHKVASDACDVRRVITRLNEKDPTAPKQ